MPKKIDACLHACMYVDGETKGKQPQCCCNVNGNAHLKVKQITRN